MCSPTTAPVLDSSFFQRESGLVEQLSLASVPLRVLADSDPNPDVSLYGSRALIYDDENDLENSIF